MTIQRMRIIGVVGGSVAAAMVAVAVAVASCAPTPPNVTLRTFRQAQKVDVVCIQVNDANGNAVSPVPKVEDQCTPVPSNVLGSSLQFHLYALVTQTTPGTLAVVDLTAGNVVDVDRSTPGVDFVPVGANPTDVAVTPDGNFTFVSSADPNKMAIYAIDNKRLLGDSTSKGSPALRLPDLRACALPQPPRALAIVPTGAAGGGAATGYALVAMLRASGGKPAVIATIDTPSLEGAVGDGGVPPRAPGSLDPCIVLGATQLSGDLPASWTPGPPWADGVPYADAGDFRLEQPSLGPQCASPSSDGGAVADAGSMDAGAGDATPADGGANDAGNAAGVPAAAARPTSMAMRNDMPVLYVADDAVPVIHVIDLHDPTSPRQLQPLLATNVADPAQRVSVGAIAISPTTHDYKTYLYAIDARQGSLMVYDITDPATSPHTPLQRPHPELNPLAPLDRLRFFAPVATIAFARHDWPVPSQSDSLHQYTGLLCNPNPNAHPDAGAFLDRGAYYRADQAGLIQSMVTNGGTVQTFPSRLRGVFAFATLSNGVVVTIDVDDWDAPCRRPDPMIARQVTGALDLPEPDLGDLDPYHAPQTYNRNLPGSAAVTLEAFFPVSAPHRIRSASLLRADPTAGVHVPNLLGVPQLYNAGGAPAVVSGTGGSIGPVLLPAPMPPGFIDPTYIQNPTEPNTSARTFSSAGLETASPAGSPIPLVLFPGGSDPSVPGVRVSFDDPTAHLDQDWTVTYEGALPTVSGIAATMIAAPHDDSPQTLTLSAPGAHFCARGIEDWDLGQARANQVLATIGTAFSDPKPVLPVDLPRWTSDYVEIIDDLLPSTDPYWGLQDATACWDTQYATADQRYNVCQQTFGAATTDADTHLARDLPILHARDDSLEVGRFGWFNTDPNGPKENVVPEQTTNRVVVPADPSNAPFLRLIRCCFHKQAAFKVRTGGQWVAAGTGVGLLHHVKADPSGACVLSCDPRDALMNARAFDIPWAADATSCARAAAPAFDRDSPLAMRNPMFSFVAWSGCPGATPRGFGDHTQTTRDLTWKFSVRGSFSALAVSLTSASTGSAVSPQSMRYINSLGQLAVVDGESQGLVLIDLNLVNAVHNYF